MNSCENSNASTKLQGSKSSELWEESTSNSSSIKTVGDNTDKFDKKSSKTTKGESDTTNVNDSGVPRGTLVICPRNSGGFLGDHCFSRIKQRTGSSSNTRNEFRMARGNNSGERIRPGQRGRPFKKNQNDRDSNTEGGGGGYHSTSRQKFQESLKNHDNSQNKYYDDKRLNGMDLLFINKFYLFKRLFIQMDFYYKCNCR